MLSRDHYIISEALKELGFKVLPAIARNEQCSESSKNYICIIIRECYKNKRPDIIEWIIKAGVITRSEFFIILSDNIKRRF